MRLNFKEYEIIKEMIGKLKKLLNKRKIFCFEYDVYIFFAPFLLGFFSLSRDTWKSKFFSWDPEGKSHRLWLKINRRQMLWVPTAHDGWSFYPHIQHPLNFLNNSVFINTKRYMWTHICWERDVKYIYWRELWFCLPPPSPSSFFSHPSFSHPHKFCDR